MSLKRVVNWVETAAAAAAVVFVIMLFANEGGGGGATSPGAQLFAANCASCHGADGGGGLGPRLAGHVTKKFPDVEDQIAFVKKGKGAMPSFAGDLTDEEIRMVVEFTRTDLGK
jgi:mono/diheme cytochrome c family protein